MLENNIPDHPLKKLHSSMLTIGVLKEPQQETRVSLTPEIAGALTKSNINIIIEHGAGEKAFPMQ